MKIVTTFSIMAITAFACAAAHADSKDRASRDLDCESRASTSGALDTTLSACTTAGRQERRPADTVGAEGEKRLASDRVESQAIVDRLQSKYGQSSWYESASDAELGSALEDAKTLLSHLSALSVDLGDGAIANQESVLDGIRDTVAVERKCRSDKRCMADRAAKKSEDAFLASIVAPLCDADNVLEIARAEVSSERSSSSSVANQSLMHADGDEVKNAKRTIKELMADYAKVRHHAFKGWRSECQVPRDGRLATATSQGGVR